MGQSNWVHVDVEEILHETDSAFLCTIDGEDMWIPKSQISEPDDYAKGNKNLTLSITEWFANERGIEGS